MIFKIGQVVQHKITKEKFVITKIFPKKWYRKHSYLECSDGKKDSYHENIETYDIFESELEEVKTWRKK